MSHSEQEHLVQMLNQIVENNISYGDETAVSEVVASHVKKFWPRRMKQMLNDCVAQGGGELHPIAVLAANRLQQAS